MKDYKLRDLHASHTLGWSWVSVMPPPTSTSCSSVSVHTYIN